MKKVPRTSLVFEISGCDHAARRPLRKATSRKSTHNGSEAMSEAITCFFRNAAVPHEPTHGPIFTGSMASAQPPGTLGPAAGLSCLPSGSISRTEEIISGEWASTLSHKSSKISVSPAPPEINSRARLSADKSDSRWASLEAWPASFSLGPLEAAGVGSRLEDDAEALMNSPTVWLGSGNMLRYSS